MEHVFGWWEEVEVQEETMQTPHRKPSRDLNQTLLTVRLDCYLQPVYKMLLIHNPLGQELKPKSRRLFNKRTQIESITDYYRIFSHIKIGEAEVHRLRINKWAGLKVLGATKHL